MKDGTLDAAAFVRAMAQAGWRVVSVHASRRTFVHAGGATLVVAFHERMGLHTFTRIRMRAGADAPVLPPWAK